MIKQYFYTLEFLDTIGFLTLAIPNTITVPFLFQWILL